MGLLSVWCQRFSSECFNHLVAALRWVPAALRWATAHRIIIFNFHRYECMHNLMAWYPPAGLILFRSSPSWTISAIFPPTSRGAPWSSISPTRCCARYTTSTAEARRRHPSTSSARRRGSPRTSRSPIAPPGPGTTTAILPSPAALAIRATPPRRATEEKQPFCMMSTAPPAGPKSGSTGGRGVLRTAARPGKLSLSTAPPAAAEEASARCRGLRSQDPAQRRISKEGSI